MLKIKHNSSFLQIYLKLKHHYRKGESIVLVPKGEPLTILRMDDSKTIHYVHDTHLGNSTLH